MIVDSLDIPVGGCIPSGLTKSFLEANKGTEYYPDNYILISSGGSVTVNDTRSPFNGVTITVQEARTIAGMTDGFQTNIGGDFNSSGKLLVNIDKTNLPGVILDFNAFTKLEESVDVTDNLKWGEVNLNATIEDWTYSDSSVIDSDQRYWSGSGTVTRDRGATVTGSGFGALISPDDNSYNFDKFNHCHNYQIDHYHQLAFVDTNAILPSDIDLDITLGTPSADLAPITLELDYKEIQPCWLLRIY